MKTITVFFCLAVGLFCCTAFAGPERLSREVLHHASAAPERVRHAVPKRLEFARKRPAYDVRSLRVPVDRSIEVLEGDAIAWRSARRMLA